MQEETEDQKTEPEVAESEEHKSPEDLAVEEAEAAVVAEEAKPDDKPKEDENAEFEEATDGTVDKKTDEPKEEAEPRTVPIVALHDTRNKLEEANLRVARLEGELAATRKPVEEVPEPTPQERIDTIREQKLAFAKKFDDGDIDAVQMEKARQELEDAERAIHEEENGVSTAPQTAHLDSTIEQNLVRLAEEFPVISAIGEDEMRGFVEQALRQAETNGKPFGPGALETLRLHNEAAAIAHNHYARFFAPPESPKLDGGKSGDQSQELEGLSDKAKARSDKLDVAAKHPPNINQIGSAAEGTLSDEQINSKMEGMSESERIEFLEQMPGLAKRLTGVG